MQFVGRGAGFPCAFPYDYPPTPFIPQEPVPQTNCHFAYVTRRRTLTPACATLSLVLPLNWCPDQRRNKTGTRCWCLGRAYVWLRTRLPCASLPIHADPQTVRACSPRARPTHSSASSHNAGEPLAAPLPLRDNVLWSCFRHREPVETLRDVLRRLRPVPGPGVMPIPD